MTKLEIDIVDNGRWWWWWWWCGWWFPSFIMSIGGNRRTIEIGRVMRWIQDGRFGWEMRDRREWYVDDLLNTMRSILSHLSRLKLSSCFLSLFSILIVALPGGEREIKKREGERVEKDKKKTIKKPCVSYWKNQQDNTGMYPPIIFHFLYRPFYEITRRALVRSIYLTLTWRPRWRKAAA